MTTCYINGTYQDISKSKVSITDRGFQFSDGVYEVIAVYENKFVDSIVKINKELQWMDPSNRGYLFLDCMEDKIIASFNFIKELNNINSEISSSHSFVIYREGLELKEIKA